MVGPEGLPTNFGWEGDVPAGTYLLATPTAAHFPAAGDGDQALLLQGTLTTLLGTAQAGQTWTVGLSLLSGTFPDDPPGTLTVLITLGGSVLATADLATPTTPGVWEAHVVEARTDAGGELRLSLVATGGYPWVDAVDVAIE